MTGLAALFRTRRNRWWQAFLLLLSLALAGQSIAVSAHRHAPERSCVSAPACKAPAKPHKADNCALCQEARVSGHYLPVTPMVLALALLAAFLLHAALGPRRVRVAATIPWRSRAPPLRRARPLPLTI